MPCEGSEEGDVGCEGAEGWEGEEVKMECGGTKKGK